MRCGTGTPSHRAGPTGGAAAGAWRPTSPTGCGALGGVLTPYSEYRITGGADGTARRIAGVRFSGSETLQLSLFGERQTLGRGETRSQLSVELRRLF